MRTILERDLVSLAPGMGSRKNSLISQLFGNHSPFTLLSLDQKLSGRLRRYGLKYFSRDSRLFGARVTWEVNEPNLTPYVLF